MNIHKDIFSSGSFKVKMVVKTPDSVLTRIKDAIYINGYASVVFLNQTGAATADSFNEAAVYTSSDSALPVIVILLEQIIENRKSVFSTDMDDDSLSTVVDGIRFEKSGMTVQHTLKLCPKLINHERYLKVWFNSSNKVITLNFKEIYNLYLTLKNISIPTMTMLMLNMINVGDVKSISTTLKER